jgi:Zn-dependent protease with chaperone function/Tol biopolymer transport system component
MIHYLSPEKWSKKAASVVLAIALLFFILYAMACVMSPIAWSPDSSKIALMVCPHEEPDKFAIFTYDIRTGQRTLIDQIQNIGVLSAPSWSPDGKWIAYLKSDSTHTGDELFSEDISYLNQFQSDMDSIIDKSKSPETYDINLMISTPDGKQKKVLKKIKSPGGQKAQDGLMCMQPAWSENGKRLFYPRMLTSDLCYTTSIDITSGKTIAHFPTNTPFPIISPDGKKVISVLKTEKEIVNVIVSDTDGKNTNTFNVSLDMETRSTLSQLFLWMPDSKHVLYSAGNAVMNLDINTGNIDKLMDNDQMIPIVRSEPSRILPVRISSKGDKLYYIKIKTADKMNRTESIWLESMTIKDKQITSVFELIEFPDTEIGTFNMSPDCKTFLLRTFIDQKDQQGKSVIIMWNGKARNIIETDSWLSEIFGSGQKDDLDASKTKRTFEPQLTLVSDSALYAMAMQQYKTYLSENKLSAETDKIQMVRSVGIRIQKAVESYMASQNLSARLAGYQWEYNLVENKEKNAWVMPGGKMVVYSGLFEIVSTDAKLAAVLSHEIAHAVAEHGGERLRQELLTKFGGMSIDEAIKSKPEAAQQLFTQAYATGTSVGVLLPYSRLHENEADHLGLIFMAMAGYDPQVAVDFWKKMSSDQSMRLTELIRTHPADQTRIKNIQSEIPEAKKYYNPK